MHGHLLSRVQAHRRHPRVGFALALSLAMVPATASGAVDCNFAGSNIPAVPAPECVDTYGSEVSCALGGSIRLWPSELRPASDIPADRDSTQRVAGLTIPGEKSGHELFTSVDVVSVSGVARRLYSSYNSGLIVWDLEADPANPAKLDERDGWNLSQHPSEFLSFPALSEILNYIEDISAVNISSTEDLVGVAGKNGVGPTFWTYSDISKKLQPLYQDLGTPAQQVRLAKDNAGTVYAFVGADNGIAVYNVTAARNLTNPCLEDRGDTCPTVYRGLIDARESLFLDVLHVPATDRFYVSSATKVNFNTRSLKLWEVQDPQSPGTSTTEKLSGLNWVNGGSALFSHLNHTYLAVVHEPVFQQEQLDIYLIDGCLQGGTCNLATKAVQSIALKGVPQVIGYDGYPAALDYLTFSIANGVPYLYYGFATLNLRGPSQEQLWDLSGIRHNQTLATLPELTSDGERYWDPCSTTIIPPNPSLPYQVGYWAHSYHQNTHGLNNMTPRVGKFSPQGYFYRAASTILDVHVLGGGVAQTPRISTDLAVPQSIYWMSEDELTFQGSASSGCNPDPQGWMWDTTPPAEVAYQLVSALNNAATYRFNCALPSGRCSDTNVSVVADNTAPSCAGATLVAAGVSPLKDPLIDITSLDAGGSTSFVVCQEVNLSASLVGRAPANWEWRIGGLPQCPGGQVGTADLQGTTAQCTWAATQSEDIFADGFESGDTSIWSFCTGGCGAASLTTRLAATSITAELVVWDELGSPSIPTVTDSIVLTIDSSSAPQFTEVPAVSGATAGFTVTFSAPAQFTTGWHWELEDPAGGGSCTFAGVTGSVPCSVHDTTVDSVEQSWTAAGDYHYNVVASNCASSATATATGVFTLEAGIQPAVTSFALAFSEIQPGGPCCGNPLSGFTCKTGLPIVFEVSLVEAAPYQFQFDWERTSSGATPTYAGQSPTGNPSPTQWSFTHTFVQTGGLYPKVKVLSGAFFDEQEHYSVPLTVVSGPCQ